MPTSACGVGQEISQTFQSFTTLSGETGGIFYVLDIFATFNWTTQVFVIFGQ